MAILSSKCNKRFCEDLYKIIPTDPYLVVWSTDEGVHMIKTNITLHVSKSDAAWCSYFFPSSFLT